MPIRIWIAYCLTFLAAFLGIDYFSAKKLNLPISAEKFNQYFSLAYPHCMSERTCIWNFAPDPETKDEDRPVSVILWTDAGLKRDEDVVWPIRMETHAAALDSILRYKPKAVFVDILFVDDPAKRKDYSIGDLVDAIEDYQEEGVPIYFSDPNSSTVSVVEPLATVLRKNHKNNLIPVILKSNSTQIAYPAEVSTPSGVSRANGAVAIYRDNNGDTISKDETNSGDLHLFWGGRTSEINKKVWKCHQLALPETFHGILFRALREIVASTESRPDTGSIACPYTPVLPADIFVDIPACAPDYERPESSCFDRTRNFLKANVPGNEIDVDDVRRVIEDKYIVYGASFEGASDIYRVPIYDHKGLSGVFVHAMALDNLIEMDGDVPTTQTGRTMLEATLYYAISVPLSVFSFVMSGYLIFSVWHSAERRMSIPIERYALRVVHWRRRQRGNVKILEVIILKSIKLASLSVEILYHGLVIVFIGGLVLFCTWLVFLNFCIGVINWAAILLSSGVLSIWTKTPFAQGLVDIFSRGPSSDRRAG